MRWSSHAGATWIAEKSLPCPRAIIALDLRHEARPQQFTAGRRLLRRVSYGIGYHQADAIACISQRTSDDLLAAHPFLRSRRVTVALLCLLAGIAGSVVGARAVAHSDAAKERRSFDRGQRGR